MPKNKPEKIKAEQLEQAAFKAGLDYQIPDEVSAAVDQYLSGEPTFQSDPRVRAQRFEAEVEAPALRAFRREIVPTLNERFVARGVQGPAQEATLLDAGTDLATNLAAMRSQFFRADEDRDIAAREAALGRVGAGASARLNESILPIQLKASLGAQARGVENAQALQSYLRDLLSQQQNSANALAAAIRNSVPQPFRFEPEGPDGPEPWQRVLGMTVPGFNTAFGGMAL